MNNRPWTEQDLADLRSLLEQGLHARIIGKRLDRSEGAVRGKAFELGLSWKGRNKRLALRP